MGIFIDFRKDTKCRVPGLYREVILSFTAKTCSSCEKPCKVCRNEMAGITLLSVQGHDESLSANLFNLRLIYIFRSLHLVNSNQFVIN